MRWEGGKRDVTRTYCSVNRELLECSFRGLFQEVSENSSVAVLTCARAYFAPREGRKVDHNHLCWRIVPQETFLIYTDNTMSNDNRHWWGEGFGKMWKHWKECHSWESIKSFNILNIPYPVISGSRNRTLLSGFRFSLTAWFTGGLFLSIEGGHLLQFV